MYGTDHLGWDPEILGDFIGTAKMNDEQRKQLTAKLVQQCCPEQKDECSQVIDTLDVSNSERPICGLVSYSGVLAQAS